MKKNYPAQQGISLVELVVGMLLLIIVLTATVSLFSTFLQVWSNEKSHTSMTQTARSAVDRMVREIRDAKSVSLDTTSSLTIRKFSGERNTFQRGSGFHANTLYLIIDKEDATLNGGLSANPITENVITNLVFTPCPDPVTSQVILISLEVTDPQTGKKHEFHTGACPWNSYQTLLYSKGGIIHDE